MHEAAEFVPLVHATKPDAITEADRNPVGQFDVVCDQQGVVIPELQDEPLMSIAFAVV